MSKLKAIQIKTLPPGNHSDGDNLYLRVKDTGARSWVFRYKVDGRAFELGLGSIAVRSLQEARHLAADMKRAIFRGQNPKSILTPKLQQKKTFQEYANELIEHKKAGWRNAKHAQQWHNTLIQYVCPAIGRKPVSEVSVDDLKRILKPIWNTKTETASRVRMRIEAILDYGYLTEGLERSNPARWKGCLDKIFPPRKKVQAVQHFNAIHYKNLAAVMDQLRLRDTMTAFCLRWIMLTACRSGEARKMVWSDVDIESRVWSIPKDKAKTGVMHRIPLNDECLQILAQVKSFNVNSEVVFSNKLGNPFSDVALSKLLKSVSYPTATVHGLRSSFRDWCAESNVSMEVSETALAHSLKEVQAAYRRSDLFELRRVLMEDWGRYLRNRD